MTTDEFDARHPRCCHECGWALSAHRVGEGCPWGFSPAARAGDLPDREDRA